MVAGGGIGGLVAALSLHAAGLGVEVFESVAAVRPLGVGINLLPHAVRELDELGLRTSLEKLGVATSELVYFSKHGRRIWREPRGVAAGYHWPQISIHRGRLHMFLLDEARARLGTERIHTGRHLTGWREASGEIVADFGDSSASGDVLIAADGIHSAARRALYPDEGPPRWSGALLWRGTSEAPPFLSGRSMIMAGHERQKFVAYPIGEHTINWIAELRFDPASAPPRQDWNQRADPAEFLPHFETWRFDWLDVPDLVRRAETIYVYPMVDRDPLPRWSFGRMTLLGDAAHPMYPVGSNGASQAILDARVLAGCLRANAEPVRALADYEAARRPATAGIVLANRQQGPEECMTLVEQRAPHGFERLSDVISAAELAAIADKYKRLAGFSVDELNRRPSLAEGGR
jgi:2-polyprenyl-6-methoxyphenol hydroxylase-like FAD-dependent oxidoreductase